MTGYPATGTKTSGMLVSGDRKGTESASVTEKNQQNVCWHEFNQGCPEGIKLLPGNCTGS